jgi:hypothetical protein
VGVRYDFLLDAGWVIRSFIATITEAREFPGISDTLNLQLSYQQPIGFENNSTAYPCFDV